MIARLNGTIDHKTERGVIIDVAGVGYEVALSAPTLQKVKIGETTSFWTYLAVREDALDLYGFLDRKELEFFKLLITISGIGPKSAITILSLAQPEVLEKAIAAGDANYLTKISGLGKKSAEKIVVGLKDKIAAIITHQTGQSLQEESEAFEALRSLGYGLPEARQALLKVSGEAKDTVGKVKAALRLLGKK